MGPRRPEWLDASTQAADMESNTAADSREAPQPLRRATRGAWREASASEEPQADEESLQAYNERLHSELKESLEYQRQASLEAARRHDVTLRELVELKRRLESATT